MSNVLHAENEVINADARLRSTVRKEIRYLQDALHAVKHGEPAAATDLLELSISILQVLVEDCDAARARLGKAKADECVHERLFAHGAPVGVLSSSPEYQAWPNS